MGEISKGVLFPKHRADLLHTTVASERMRTGLIEAIAVPQNPLDILAQQTVAAVALDTARGGGLVGDRAALARRSRRCRARRSRRRSTCCRAATRPTSSPSCGPRIVWDRVAGTIAGRPGAQRLAVTSGGTIPDRGMFGVFIVGTSDGARRVGELDEEMVYESRVGDVFALGATSWRIEEITSDRVLVTPGVRAAGARAVLEGRRARAAGRARQGDRLVRAASSAAPRSRSTTACVEAGLDPWAVDNLQALRARAEAGDRHGADRHDARGRAVPRRARRLAARAAFPVRHAGARAVGAGGLGAHPRAARRRRLGDGRRRRDRRAAARDRRRAARAPTCSSSSQEELEQLVTLEVGGSALFAARFRESAARALLLPRYNPGRRSPLWQQRQRSAQLLEVARKYPSFPIILETVREVLQDVYDLPALASLTADIAARKVRLVEVETDSPSPFARSLLFGYVAAFMYEGDSPLAERRAAALSLDPTLLAELLGRAELRELLDPAVIAQTELELQRLDPDRHAKDAEGLLDLLRLLGPLSTDELAAAVAPPSGVVDRRQRASSPTSPAPTACCAPRSPATSAGPSWRTRAACATPSASRCRSACRTPSSTRSPTRSATWSAGTCAPTARSRPRMRPTRLGLGIAIVTDALRRLASDRRVVEGEFRPGATGSEWVDAEVLRRLRSRSLAALRSEVEPVAQQTLGRFLPDWQHVGQPGTSARTPRHRRRGERDRPARRRRRSRHPPGRASCCPAASATTAPRCSTS